MSKISIVLLSLLILVFCSFVLVLIGFVVFTGYTSIKADSNDCLVKIAKDYCLDNGLFYEDIFWMGEYQFSCGGNPRQRSSLENFNFLEEELERCKNENKR